MATIFNSDLETETSAFETEWDSKAEEGSNTLTISTTAAHVHSGTNGALTTFDGTNNGCYAIKTVSDQAEVYTRQYVKFNSAFAIAQQYTLAGVLELKDGGQYLARVGAKVGIADQDFTWYLTWWNGSGNVIPSMNESITLNQWYLVELHWKAGDGASGGCELKIDGVSIASDFYGAQSAARCDIIRAGANAGASGVPTSDSELYWDDFASDDAGWVGAIGAGVEIAPTLLTSELNIYNPVVSAGSSTWDMGPYVYTITGTTTAVNPPSLQTSLQIHNPVVYAVDYPTAIAPPLLQTSIQMFNPTVNTGTFRNRIASMLHLIMGR